MSDANEIMLRAKENCRAILKVLTKQDHVLFTRRANESIRMSMRIVTKLEKSNVLYQEEGGWLTYKKYIEQANLFPLILSTNDGLIFEKELSLHEHDSVLLINSMAAYSILHDMSSVSNACFTNDVFLVNDVSGSIGTNEATFGELVLGSFGNGKPVNLGTGGFLATNNPDLFDFLKELEPDFKEEELNFVLLEKKLLNLEQRRQFLRNKVISVKEDLKKQNFNIVHPDGEGLNVIVRFSNEEEKKQIEKYCEDSDLEFTVCPREIRILDDAISIEIKRLTD